MREDWPPSWVFFPAWWRSASGWNPGCGTGWRASIPPNDSISPGGGPNVATAYEVALKIKETSYRKTEGFQLEQYLHGPFVATHPGVASTFIVPSGPGRSRAMDLIAAVNTVGGHSVALIEEADSEIVDLAETALSLPPTCEALTPITYLVPASAIHLLARRGIRVQPGYFPMGRPAPRRCPRSLSALSRESPSCTDMSRSGSNAARPPYRPPAGGMHRRRSVASVRGLAHMACIRR